MRCPYCPSELTEVKDSRPGDELSFIRRRRACPGCNRRFTTHERRVVETLWVLKRSGKRVPFDAEKVAASVHWALGKGRRFDPLPGRVAARVEQALEQRGDAEVASKTIATMVMGELVVSDPVAYVRWASVYLEFTEPEQFRDLIADKALGR